MSTNSLANLGHGFHAPPPVQLPQLSRAPRVLALDEVVASIVHEINQPLAAMMINAEASLRWLDRANPDVSEACELMRRIVADARRTADILLRIRGMAAQASPKCTLLVPQEVIEEAVRCLRHEIRSNDVITSLELSPALPKVLGDRIQLHQVLVNLAINAIQAMTHAGTPRRILAIRAIQSDPDMVTCAVEDSGPGIEPHHLDRVFESFFTTKDTGMGMGLAISRVIIEAHGGKLKAENGSIYGGARFTFTLPAASDALS